MSYCICYDKIPVSKRPEKRKLPVRGIAFLLVITAVVAIAVSPQLRIHLLGVLFPGFGEEALTAVDMLAKQIGDGQPLAQAFHAFCLEVLAPVNG